VELELTQWENTKINKLSPSNEILKKGGGRCIPDCEICVPKIQFGHLFPFFQQVFYPIETFHFKVGVANMKNFKANYWPITPRLFGMVKILWKKASVWGCRDCLFPK
jgi:hypothetical protein